MNTIDLGSAYRGHFPQFLPTDYALIIAAVQAIPGAIVYYREGDRPFDVVVEGTEKKDVTKALKDANLDGKIKIKDESYKNKETKIRITTYCILPKD